MARISDKNLTLKDGRHVKIRSANRCDARALSRFKCEMLHTSQHLNTQPDEAQVSTGAERRLIKRIIASENEIAIVALHGGDIIASLETLTDRRGRLKHSTLMGISVAHGFRGQALGRAMLECCLEWAKAHPYIERVELHVHDDNDKAISLYKALGFVEEGRKKDAIRRGPQDYVDDILMCAYLGRKSVE